MRVVIAPDKFKGTASAREMAERIATVLGDIAPEADPTLIPLADGGEGSLDVLSSVAFRRERCSVQGAWGEPADADILWTTSGEAWVEMAQTAGAGDRRGPQAALEASTYGTGMLLDLVDAQGDVVVAVGGTLTSDGGTGLASALGWRFVDEGGKDVGRGALHLERISRIVPSERTPSRCVAACDVLAPLLGERGAAHRFAPQKGADARAVETIERGLAHLAATLERELGTEVADLPGSGAGGGSGAGLAAFLDADLRSGFELIASRVGLERAIEGADVVITGEGAFDEGSLEGKTPIGVLALARRHGVPCVLIAGRISADPRVHGFAASADLGHGLAPAVSSVLSSL